MFESLSEKLGNVFGKLRGKGALSENDVMAVSREIRVALLEADVALPVVKDFIEHIKERATGQNVIKGINPGQQIIKIVHDELVQMLGAESSELKFGAAPCAYLMVGLQGSGKTTSTAKIAKILTEKHKKKVLMASLDIYRPAAQEQLKQLGEQTAQPGMFFAFGCGRELRRAEVVLDRQISEELKQFRHRVDGGFVVFAGRARGDGAHACLDALQVVIEAARCIRLLKEKHGHQPRFAARLI